MTVAANADDLPIRERAEPRELAVVARDADAHAIVPVAPPPTPPTTTAIVLAAPTLEYTNRPLWQTPTRRLILPGPRENRPTRLAWTAIAIGVAAVYLWFLLCYWAPAHPGVDQNGYLAGGERYAYSFSTGNKPPNPYGFVGRMWVLAPDGTYYPKYPIGLPILYAAAVRAGALFHVDGHFVGELLSPVSAMLAALGVFAIVRRLSGGFVGVIAMLLVGFGQTMLTLSINPNSHAAGTAAIVWGVAMTIGWLERGTLWRGLCAGALLGFAYLIRYTDGLLALPLGVAMLYAARWAIPGLRRAIFTVAATLGFVVIAWVVGRFGGAGIVRGWDWLTPLAADDGKPFKLGVAAVAAASLVSLFIPARTLWRLLAVGFAWLTPVAYQTLFNMVAMKTFTSYGNTNESTGFSTINFVYNWEKMVRVLADQGLFFVAPIGLLGLIAMFRRLPLVATILTLWFVPEVLLYTAYYWAPDNMGVSYSRFVLTQLPALAISAAWLMGEVSRGGRLTNFRGWYRPDAPHVAAAAIAFVGGVALAAWGASSYAARLLHGEAFATVRRAVLTDSTPWLTVVPGALVAIVGAAALLASVGFARRFRESFEWHAGHGIARLGVGVVAFVACALGGWRATQGSEWGQRLNARASLELQSRENNNLAAVGDAVRDVVHRDATTGKPDGKPDADVLLFGDSERLHHIQWLGNYECYAADAFTPEAGRRMSLPPGTDTTDPDPLDPRRVEFARALYADKDQNALTAEQNKLMSDALAAGKRVFYVLNKPQAQLFERRFVKTDKFITRDRATITDAPSPRDASDFLSPEEQPKLPVGRMGMRGRQVPDRFVTPERGTYRIVEILPKPVPVVPPAMAKALAEKAAKATTKP